MSARRLPAPPPPVDNSSATDNRVKSLRKSTHSSLSEQNVSANVSLTGKGDQSLISKPSRTRSSRPSSKVDLERIEEHIYANQEAIIEHDANQSIYSEVSYDSYLDSTFDSTSMLDNTKQNSIISSPGCRRSSNSPSQRSLSTEPISISSTEEPIPLSFDLFIGSNHVFALNESNFVEVGANPLPSIVMFYDPFAPESIKPKMEFKQAAETKNPENRQFGGVNCVQEREFCDKMGITPLPMYKLFAGGKEVSAIKDTTKFDPKTMTSFLDTLASIKQEKNEQSKSLPSVKKKSKCSLAKIFGFKK